MNVGIVVLRGANIQRSVGAFNSRQRIQLAVGNFNNAPDDKLMVTHRRRLAKWLSSRVLILFEGVVDFDFI
jgi:hypothetical protein